MELTEAIIHAREVAEGCSSDNRDCAYQHDKLADWLEELQRYKRLEEQGRLVILPAKEEVNNSRCCKTCYADDMEWDEVDNPCWNCKGDHSEWMPKEPKVTWDDLPEDIKEIVEWGLYTKEEAIEKHKRYLKDYLITLEDND